MPHVTLEYSANIPEPADLEGLFRRLHEALVPLGPFDIQDFKSRAYRTAQYCVGPGGAPRGFVHLTLAILDRRSLDIQKAAGETALALLREAFARALTEQDCDLTVEVREMRMATYFKVRSAPR